MKNSFQSRCICSPGDDFTSMFLNLRGSYSAIYDWYTILITSFFSRHEMQDVMSRNPTRS